METVTLNVNEIETADRHALEHVIGTQLTEDQKVVIQVLSADVAKAIEPKSVERNSEAGKLPEWCNVYEGMSDDEIDEIERSIVRSYSGRSFP